MNKEAFADKSGGFFVLSVKPKCGKLGIRYGEEKFHET